MIRLQTRAQRWLATALVALLLLSLTAVLFKPRVERAIQQRIESTALRHGMVARIGSVHVGLWPLVRLANFDLDIGSGFQLHADGIAATYPGTLRLALDAAHLVGPAGLSLHSPRCVWQVTGTRGEDLVLTLRQPQAGLVIREQVDAAGKGWNVEIHGLEIDRLLDLRREGARLLAGGIAEGALSLRNSGDALQFHVDVSARGARLGLLGDSDGGPPLGDATDVALRFNGAFQRTEGSFEIRNIRGTLAGAELAGSIVLQDMNEEPSVDLTLGVKQLAFGKLLGTAGLAVPESLGASSSGNRDLGAANIQVSARGSLADPAALAVTQKIHFTPPKVMPPAIARLRRDFVFRADEGMGPHRSIDVSPTSPDFIALQDVPPLFVRTLLISEDAGFYGHSGIDLRELPTALLTNLSRGAAARGASTISQQLAKNLFLSRDKQVGRKLQELAISFLLESELSKNRILEIYLNIIEWGPDLRGLRPAARRYFDCEPQALTPAQMAFLVAIIPGPIKYQSSFADGTPGPGLRVLVDNLLAKLRSVEAIDEEEYQRALAEPIFVAGGKPRG